MNVVLTHCAALDVHKKTVMVCRMTPDLTGQQVDGLMEVQEFGTLMRELLRLADWLAEVGVMHVAMESMGEYWKPVYNILEGNCEGFLVNAAYVATRDGFADIIANGYVDDFFDAAWDAAGMIRMEVHPERSSGSVVDNVPQTRTSEVTTNVLVPDGSTMVIGGLMERIVEKNQNGVPFFNNLPVVGALFRERKHTASKKELVVLLTPHSRVDYDVIIRASRLVIDTHSGLQPREAPNVVNIWVPVANTRQPTAVR